ncbi:MAG: hypothetical protein WD342_12385 [Verrucomicrobiales bacterium]
MSDFISTSCGKIVNVNAIAFVTTRNPPAREGEEPAPAIQLVIGFAAATSFEDGRARPLSLVMQGGEALEFLDQLAARGVVVHHLREKVS